MEAGPRTPSSPWGSTQSSWGLGAQGLTWFCCRVNSKKNGSPAVLPGKSSLLGRSDSYVEKEKKKSFLDSWAMLQKRAPMHLAVTVPMLSSIHRAPCAQPRLLPWVGAASSELPPTAWQALAGGSGASGGGSNQRAENPQQKGGGEGQGRNVFGFAEPTAPATEKRD